MSEIGDIGRAIRDAGRERRASHRQTTPELLRERGIAFESKNGGAHLIVRHAALVADLWPGTGKYMVRSTGRYKRGVFNLLRDLGVKP